MLALGGEVSGIGKMYLVGGLGALYDSEVDRCGVAGDAYFAGDSQVGGCGEIELHWGRVMSCCPIAGSLLHEFNTCK